MTSVVCIQAGAVMPRGRLPSGLAGFSPVSSDTFEWKSDLLLCVIFGHA